MVRSRRYYGPISKLDPAARLTGSIIWVYEGLKLHRGIVKKHTNKTVFIMLDDGTELENPPHFFDLLPDAKKYARKHIKDMIKMAIKADVSPVAFQKALAAISKTPT